MPSAVAKAKHVRISPKKVRLIANMIRGANVEVAAVQLKFSYTKGGRELLKTLNSAIANAETLHSVQRKDLKVKEIRVDQGTAGKRSKSKSRGGRVPILKRCSHFTIVVGTEE